MQILRHIAAILTILAFIDPVMGQDLRCLNRDEQKAAISENRALPVAKVLRQNKSRIHGEVVRVRLCERSGQLYYMLTILPRTGKVASTTVEAATGDLIRIEGRD